MRNVAYTFVVIVAIIGIKGCMALGPTIDSQAAADQANAYSRQHRNMSEQQKEEYVQRLIREGKVIDARRKPATAPVTAPTPAAHASVADTAPVGDFQCTVTISHDGGTFVANDRRNTSGECFKEGVANIANYFAPRPNRSYGELAVVEVHDLKNRRTQPVLSIVCTGFGFGSVKEEFQRMAREFDSGGAVSIDTKKLSGPCLVSSVNDETLALGQGVIRNPKKYEFELFESNRLAQ